MVNSFKNKAFELISRRIRVGIANRRKATLSLFEKGSGGNLLDLGCGDGEFTAMIEERIGAKDAYGIEVRQEEVIASKARGIKAFQGDLNGKLPFEDESFDVVCVIYVISLLYNLHGFLREVVILEPNLASTNNILALLLGRQPSRITISDEVYVGTIGMKKYARVSEGKVSTVVTMQALKDLLEWHGFNVERAVSFGFYPFPLFLAKALCYLDKRHAAYLIVKARKR